MYFSCKKKKFDRFFDRLDRPVKESQPYRPVDPTGFHLWLATTLRYYSEFNETSTVKIYFNFLEKKFVCSHSYCRDTVNKEIPTYQLLHSSINDKNAVHAKRIKKARLQLLLHIASDASKWKFHEDKLESWTEQKKHSNFGKLRTKKSRFVSKLRKVSFFPQSPRGGLTPDPLPCIHHWGPSPRLSAWWTQKRCSGGEPLQWWRAVCRRILESESAPDPDFSLNL